jgi:hypothetical protein
MQNEGGAHDDSQVRERLCPQASLILDEDFGRDLKSTAETPNVFRS